MRTTTSPLPFSPHLLTCKISAVQNEFLLKNATVLPEPLSFILFNYDFRPTASSNSQPLKSLSLYNTTLCSEHFLYMSPYTSAIFYGIKYLNTSNNMKPASLKPFATVKRSISNYHFLKFLSGGDSGVVYLARDLLLGKEVALKIMSKASVSSTRASNIQRLQMSIEVGGKSVLLPVLASWHDTNNYYLVTEYASGGDLAHEIIRCVSFDESRARFYTTEMILAIEELRKSRIVHRDIKPTNILMDEAGHVRLTSFGCAKKFEADKGYEDLDNSKTSLSFEVDGSCDSGVFFNDMPPPKFKTNELCGTPHFMSPERIQGKEYGVDEDLWSLGVILYLMLTGRLPFWDDNQDFKSIRHSVLKDPLQFKRNDFVSDDAKSLLYSMLAKNLGTRLSLEQIKSHRFFRDTEWDQVRKHEARAPWIPFLTPLPKGPMTNPPKNTGRAYKDVKDPIPSFTYTSPKLGILQSELQREPKVVQKGKKPPISSVAKLFRSKKKELRSIPEPTLAIVLPAEPVSRGVHEVIKPHAVTVQEQESYIDEQEQEYNSIESEIEQLLGGVQGSHLPCYKPQASQVEPLQVPRLFKNAALCDVTIQKIPAQSPCSAEVEEWKTDVHHHLEQEKRNLSPIPEEDEEEEDRRDNEVSSTESSSLFDFSLDDFPLPPGYVSFEPECPTRHPLSPLAMLAPSPTPTVYLPTPLSSPTPTLVSDLPSASPSLDPALQALPVIAEKLKYSSRTGVQRSNAIIRRRLNAKDQDQKQAMDNVASTGDTYENRVQQILEDIGMGRGLDGAVPTIVHDTDEEIRNAGKGKRQLGVPNVLDHLRDCLGKLFSSSQEEGCPRAL